MCDGTRTRELAGLPNRYSKPGAHLALLHPTRRGLNFAGGKASNPAGGLWVSIPGRLPVPDSEQFA